MKTPFYCIVFFVLFFVGCKKNEETKVVKAHNEVSFANGLEIHNYGTFTVMKVTKPWPEATKGFTYVCANSKENIPDSLQQFTFIKTPMQNVVVTSTTHISSIVSLSESDKIKGFPNLNYISSPIVRNLIDNGKIKELNDNESLNFEKTIDLKPDVIVGLSINNETAKFNQFEKAGIPVLYNADWVENSPLGKAEWIKFFGVLFNKQKEATAFFDNIVKEYNNAKSAVAHVSDVPTVLSGAIFQDVWYAPQGESWMADFITDAKGQYIWKDSKGTGSLSLSLESVLDKGIQADVWIGPGQFTSYAEMLAANQHYKQFEAFKQKSIFSYSLKKGTTGGIIFYEDATNRPDLVLKDLISILHPTVLKGYQPTFIAPLQ